MSDYKGDLKAVFVTNTCLLTAIGYQSWLYWWILSLPQVLPISVPLVKENNIHRWRRFQGFPLLRAPQNLDDFPCSAFSPRAALLAVSSSSLWPCFHRLLCSTCDLGEACSTQGNSQPFTAAPGSVQGAAHVVWLLWVSYNTHYRSVPWVYLLQVPLLNNIWKSSFFWDFYNDSKWVNGEYEVSNRPEFKA